MVSLGHYSPRKRGSARRRELPRLALQSHKLTTVNFGPQINFLVGMNGSGKSAILTGITMALGGNAKLTVRLWLLLSGFVREGCSVAKASVKLRNRGSDAYHHNVYGDSITIERTLRVNGGGQYKMISAEGVTICTKKHTLDLIREFRPFAEHGGGADHRVSCTVDHYNIQVEYV
jgi:structural maintenance of chromosomes protein 6